MDYDMEIPFDDEIMLKELELVGSQMESDSCNADNKKYQNDGGNERCRYRRPSRFEEKYEVTHQAITEPLPNRQKTGEIIRLADKQNGNRTINSIKNVNSISNGTTKRGNDNDDGVLGTGSFGSVLRCRRRSDGYVVVVKKIDLGKGDLIPSTGIATGHHFLHDSDDKFEEMLSISCAREVRALCLLNHPFIVSIYEAFIDLGILYIR